MRNSLMRIPRATCRAACVVSVSIFALSLSNTVNALPFWRTYFFEWCPFAGADYRWFFTGGSGPVRHILPDSYPGGTIYVGSKFHEIFGLELGYNRTARRHKTRLTRPRNQHGSARLTSYSIDANFYFQIVPFCWEMFGGPGIESMKARIRVDGPFIGQTSQFDTRGHVWRFGVGTQYIFPNSIGVRALGRYESTELLKINGEKIMKTSLSASLGLFYKF